ncbi:perilipin-3-like isoform X3 [Rhineura floridana]|uniref:perilipin-3-like isoform X3 n=1 Tax=Rhineura floridana TaxID=261503 RepID=UPI002AC8156B|nr:perilipin-3-like isoform X3 [Rhineura floridana]
MLQGNGGFDLEDKILGYLCRPPVASDFAMATDLKGDGPEAPKAENAVTRLGSLPLIVSTYNICSSMYNYAKDTYPCINSACSVVELVAAMAAGGVAGSVQPLLPHLEPQIAAVNKYACKGLDRLEENLLCLHQPAYQVIEDGACVTKSVISSTVSTAVSAASGAKQLVSHRVTEAVDLTKDIVQDSVNLTKSVMNSTFNTAVNAAHEARDLVSHRVADIVNLSKETAQESVDLTKSVVSSTVNTALQAAQGTKDLMTGQVRSCGAVQEGVEMTSFLRQALASGVDAMLGKTEEMVDHYLPMTNEELVKLATETQGFGLASLEQQQQQQSYFVRLGSLSSKVRHRAYLHSLDRLHLLQENTQNTLSQLQLVISLVEHLKRGVGKRVQEAQEKLNQLLLEWLQSQPGERQEEGDMPQPEAESRTLAMLRTITQDLGPAYARLVSTIKDLPTSLRERVDRAIGDLRQLHASFASATSFHDLSSGVLAQSRDKIAQAREALDGLVDHVIQNSPLNWIVGPFRSSLGAMEAMTMETENQGTATAAPDAGAAQQERVTAGSKVAKAVPKSTRKKLEAEEMQGCKGKEVTEAPAVEGPAAGIPKKTKKEMKEGAMVVKRPSKSTLNQTSEAPKTQP